MISVSLGLTRNVLERTHHSHRRTPDRLVILRGGQFALARARVSEIRGFHRCHSRRYGAIAFCGLGSSAKGGLPATFEWPIHRADQLIEVPDGRRIAVHKASARIQVY